MKNFIVFCSHFIWKVVGQTWNRFLIGDKELGVILRYFLVSSTELVDDSLLAWALGEQWGWDQVQGIAVYDWPKPRSLKKVEDEMG